ncbi:MAG TPA: lasso RiPP family leader peptide-containing protein [Vicinamibacterales bacterium]|nr:lasso RiPP family leader peptide-containing protein [Vicinamibacterales bacterium]
MNRRVRPDRVHTTASPDPAAARKPYRTPELIVHGSVRSLTRGKAGGKQDGGGKPRTRTNGGPA